MKKLVAILSVLVFATVSSGQTKNWPGYRGTHSDGLAEGATLPEEWSETKNVVWKTDIPGWGWSSPVVWGNKVFVTSAVGENELAKPKIGGYPGGHLKQTDVHRFMTYCLNVEDGKVIWEREAHKGVPPEERHPKNSFANATPVTDGERVYSCFGNIGIFCYDMSGNLLWKKKWDSAPMRGGWGPGASPVLYKDRIYFVNDNEKESYMVALDKLTGDQVWRISRDEKSNWSTPFVWETEKRTEIVTIGTKRVRSYGLDGKLLWELSGTSGLVSLMPLSKHGLLYVGAGYHYGPLYAIRPGAEGDISLAKGASSNESIAWTQKRGSSIHPCYLISENRLYVLFDAGLLTCFDAKTGETIFPRNRLRTGGGRFYASPWAYNGKVFMVNENGTTWVAEDGPEFKIVRKNVLNDRVWATPAISNGSLFIRTYQSLYRLQKQDESSQFRTQQQEPEPAK